MTEGTQNVYEILPKPIEESGEKRLFEIYHLSKRGKQHIHVASVMATNPIHAMHVAKEQVKSTQPVFNVWAITAGDIRFTAAEDDELWSTLPEKKFRDASDYKGGDKLTQIIEKIRQL